MKLSTLFLAYDQALVDRDSAANQRYAFFRGTKFPGDSGVKSPKGRLGTYHVAADTDKYALEWQHADRQVRFFGTAILRRLARLEGVSGPKIPWRLKKIPWFDGDGS